MSVLSDGLTLLGWLFLGYFVLANVGYYLPIHTAGLVDLFGSMRERAWEPPYRPEDSPFLPSIAIVTAAYNEADLIVETVGTFLDTTYPDKEVVVVNDGSTDETLDRLRAAFDLRSVDETVPSAAPCEPVRAVYRAADAPLVVIDKENGGLSDARNAGLWFVDAPLTCIVDADTILGRDALFRLLGPFLDRPSETIAVGGILHVSDAFEFDRGTPTGPRASSPVVRFQVVEYLRTFYSSRLGLTRLGCLHLISGGIGLFRTDLVRAVNGYNRVRTQHSEDLDLVLRLHKRMRRTETPYRIDFVPDPVAWTDVPDTLRDLGRQRRLWFQGLLQVVAMHRGMVGRPRYGLLGVFVLPGLILVEGVGRITEVVGYVVVLVGFAAGLFRLPTFVLFTLVSVGLSVLFSWVGVLSDVFSFRTYGRPREVAALLSYSVFEVIGFRQLWSLLALPAFADFVRDDTDWRSLVDDAGRTSDEGVRTASVATPAPSTEPARSAPTLRIGIAVVVVAVAAVAGAAFAGIGPLPGGPGGDDVPVATAEPVSEDDVVTLGGTNGTALIVAPGTAVTFTVAASDPGGTLGGVEWYVDEFRGERQLSGGEDSGTWTHTFDSPGVHAVEAAVFDEGRTYTDAPAQWTVTVVDPTATRGELRATTTDAPTTAVYVWAGSAERLVRDDAAAARFFQRLDAADVNTVYLDGYVIEDAEPADVAAFLRTAHDRGLHVDALVGTQGTDGVAEAERLTERVVRYNAGRPPPEAFDGLRYDVEPGTDDVTAMLTAYVDLLDRVESVGAGGETVGSQALPIGVDVGPGWLRRAPTAGERLVTHPSVDHLVVQAYHEDTRQVRSQLSTVTAATDKPYVLAIETEELPASVAADNITVYEQGPSAATDIVRDIESNPPGTGYRGTAIHFYGSAMSTWDAVRGGSVETATASPGETVPVRTRVVFDDYFTQSAHRSQVVVVFSGENTTYLAGTTVEPPGWVVTNATVEWTVPDTAPPGEYRATVVLYDTTVENDDRRAIATRSVPVELDRLDVGTVTVRNETTG